jgi:peptide/nickel transport system substrate-binding protein
VTGAEIQVPNFGEDMVLLLQQEARKIGFDLQIKKVPSDGYWSSVWMKTPMHVSDWFMRPTANIMLSLAFAPEANWNESQWKNERFGTLLKEARATTERAKRLELHREMQQLVSDESGILIPTHRNLVDGIATNVIGVTRNPLGSLGGCEWPEFVSFTG